MLNQEFIILGLLKSGPRHGYEIKKELKDVVGLFATITNKSIYYPLRQMEKSGVVKKNISREGARPEKYTYTITEHGDKKFKELLYKNISRLERPFFDIDMCLYFLPFLSKTEVSKRLKVRMRLLAKIEHWLKKQAKQKEKYYPHLSAIIEHNLDLIISETGFTKKLLNRLNKK